LDQTLVFNLQLLIFNQFTMKQATNNKYNLEGRTAKFSEEVIKFCRTIPKDQLDMPMISQLLRSATSIGANYMEANGASSKKDFANKIFLCKKESQETKYWLKLVRIGRPELEEKIALLWQEAQELTLIFQKITSTIRNGKNEN